MKYLSRFVSLLITLAVAAGAVVLHAAEPARLPVARERVLGLMLGSAIGDALGGPLEFQPNDIVRRLPNPPRLWRDGEVLDVPARAAAAARLQLRAYRASRPRPESYGQWNVDSLPGTITDDTRHKLILLHALRAAEQSNAWPIGAREFAQAYRDWPLTAAVTNHPAYVPLAADWLEEYLLAARWVLGERNPRHALPTERLWNGLPTCAGQMALLPLAAVFAGEPERAYHAAYQLAFIDNAWGRDMNAALVAGLAAALAAPADAALPRAGWNAVLAAMRRTDPYGYGQIRWTHRSVDRWLGLAQKFAREAQGRPARLFATLEKEFQHTTKWEAHVPFVVVFACLELADYDSLAALQLSMEWGHDTDSYAQLLGAFIGALHGPGFFRAEWREAVTKRLQADHQVDLEAECRMLDRLRELARGRELIREP